MGEIVLKNIEMTLDPESIDRAIEAVNNFKSDLQSALDELCKYLLNKGVNVARQKLNGYGIGDGSALSASIRTEMEDGSEFVGHIVAGYPGDHQSDNPKYADVSYAVFVEYGFGTANYYRRDGSRISTNKQLKILQQQHLVAKSVGRTSSHPTANKETYRPASDFKLMSYKGMGEFRGWVYKSRKDGKFYVSAGQPPKPFMYNTYIDLMNTAEQRGALIIGMFIAGRGG